MKYLPAFITLLMALTVGCSTVRKSKPIDTQNLHELQHLTQQRLSTKTSKMSKIRLQALTETAMTIGAQGALSNRANQINAMLGLNAKELSAIFNFNGLVLEHNVLPPVLEHSKQSLNLASPNTIRTTESTYKIIQQSRFVTSAPTWRTYLHFNYVKPELPDITLLPRNLQERRIWIKYINIGWQQGFAQANKIFAINLAKLQRDYKGMILYRKLLAENMITPPKVASTNMGITSNKRKTEIHINDKIFRITSIPTLSTNSNKWKPIIIQP